MREGERERGERDGARDGRGRERKGVELERMGGAALLRNAKHHISSIVKNQRCRQK